MFWNAEWKQEIRRNISALSHIAHKHPLFIDPKYPYRHNIDDAMQMMIYMVSAMEADLAAIHAAFRSQYCGDCCHDDTCGKKASIKYGDKCEQRQPSCPRRYMP